MNAQSLSSSHSLIFSPAPPRHTSYSTSRSLSFPPRTSSSSIRSSVQTYPEAPPARKSNTSTLYDVLQVSCNATQGQIKSAYRTLAKTYHPDASSQSSSAGHDFIQINKAYLTLSDPSSRALYDMKLGFGQTGSFGFSGRVAVDRSGYSHSVRRWETDQCW